MAGMSTEPIPLTVIGGYLGAGKTTLVNHLLRHPGGRRIGAVVNDFGSLAIDADLLADAASHGLVSLPNGCVCCTVGAGLHEALEAMVSAATPPDHIVIEVSGVADPAVVAAWGTVPPYESSGVIVLADATSILERSRDRYVGDEVRRQVVGADLVVVTKSDACDERRLSQVDEWVAATSERSADDSCRRRTGADRRGPGREAEPSTGGFLACAARRSVPVVAVDVGRTL